MHRPRVVLPVELLLTLLVALFPFPVRASSIVDTYTPWDKSTATGAFGATQSPTFGQTFTVTPAVTTLTEFSFWLKQDPLGGYTDVVFDGRIAAWDSVNDKITSVLWQSPYSVDLPGSAQTFKQVAFEPATPLTLTAGQQYVAFLTCSPYPSTGAADFGALIKSAATDAYTGGGAFYANNGTDLGALATTPWTAVSPFSGAVVDFAIQTNVPSTPELPTGALALAGMAPVGFAWWRRRRRAR